MQFPAEATDDIDEARLRSLLDLAGKEMAAELAQRLVADLSGVATALSGLRQNNDLAALRAQTHVLLALAGTIGASPVHDAAARLNAQARDGMRQSLSPAIDETLHLLDRLLARLRAILSRVMQP